LTSKPGVPGDIIRGGLGDDVIVQASFSGPNSLPLMMIGYPLNKKREAVTDDEIELEERIKKFRIGSDLNGSLC
jgi:hypothetical protein